MPHALVDVQATAAALNWKLPLGNEHCVGPRRNGFMFGGVGLAAAIQALERSCGRPLIWATAQYLSFARPPTVLDIEVSISTQGRSTTQARAICRAADHKILSVAAALGSPRSEELTRDLRAPETPAPEDCPVITHGRGDSSDLHGQIEVRVANGHYAYGSRAPQPLRNEDGRCMLWMRWKNGGLADTSTLAVFADHVPSAVGNAIGIAASGNSIDNTLRIVRQPRTEWVLCDIEIQSVHGGVGHGAMSLFSREGQHLAIASQTLIVRRYGEDP